MTKLPTITIAIPTFNEEKNIKVCLDSIFRQNYPRRLLEVFVIDDYSKDKTVDVARQYPVQILYNGTHDGEVGKMIAFKKAKGKYFFYADADFELRGDDWFQGMVKPLEENPEIAASFTRYYDSPRSTPLEKYLNLHPTQCGPVYEFFSPSIEETVVAENKDYRLCYYRKELIPPTGTCLHRRETLLPLVKKWKKFMELDFLVVLVEHDFHRFAYVPGVGIYHRHVVGLADLVRKRLRNVNKVYLPNVEKRKYRWFDLKKPRDVFKIVFWIGYVHLFFPALIRGIFRSLKHRTWVGLYEPLEALILTDSIILGFLANPKGRRLIKESWLGI